MRVVLLFAHTTQAVIIARPFLFTVLYFLRAKGPRMKESCVINYLFILHVSLLHFPIPQAKDPTNPIELKIQGKIQSHESKAKYPIPNTSCQRSEAKDQKPTSKPKTKPKDPKVPSGGSHAKVGKRQLPSETY